MDLTYEERIFILKLLKDRLRNFNFSLDLYEEAELRRIIAKLEKEAPR